MKSIITKGYNLKMFINTILVVLVVFLVLVFIGAIKVYHTETFAPNMNNNNHLVPGEFPLSDTQPLLYGDYKVKQNTNVTKKTIIIFGKNIPFIIVHISRKQTTNKIGRLPTMVHVRLPNSVEHPMKKRSRKNMLYLNLFQWKQMLRELTGGRQIRVNKH